MSVKEIPHLGWLGKLGPLWCCVPGVIGAPNAKKRTASESGDAGVEDVGIGRRDCQFDPSRAAKEAGPRAVDRGPFFADIGGTIDCGRQIAAEVGHGCVLPGEVPW